MRKVDSLQVGRAIAVLSIVIYHLTALSIEYQHGYFFAPWMEALRSGVDVFFVISGVVMALTTYRKFDQPGTGSRFLIHRISRIYPPYLLLSAILMIFWLLNPRAINQKNGGPDLLASFTLWPSINRLPLVQVGWSLSFEMMFYLVFFFFIIYVRKERLPRTLLLWSLIVIAGASLIAFKPTSVIFQSFPRAGFFLNVYVLEFVAGCFIGLAYLKRTLAGGWACICLAAGIFITEAVVFQVLSFDGNNKGMLRVLLFGPPAVLLIYGLVASEQSRISYGAPRWLIRCGDVSYSIYLVHLLVIHAAYRYTWRVFAHAGMLPLFLIFAGGISILFSLLFYSMIEKPLSSWTRERIERLVNGPARVAVAT